MSGAFGKWEKECFQKPEAIQALSQNQGEREGTVFTSLNPALVPDCGVSCVEVNGRYMEKRMKTQHIYIQ